MDRRPRYAEFSRKLRLRHPPILAPFNDSACQQQASREDDSEVEESITQLYSNRAEYGPMSEPDRLAAWEEAERYILTRLDRTSGNRRVKLLRVLLKALVHLSRWDEVEPVARELLSGRCSGRARAALGLVALSRGEVDLAEARLLEAGQHGHCSGRLVKELLAVGRREAPLSHLQSLMKKTYRRRHLRKWMRRIRAGGTPEISVFSDD